MTSKENRSGRQQKPWPGPADNHLELEANRNEKQQGQLKEDITELIEDWCLASTITQMY